MDNHQLRWIILKLQYRLSDSDRERLYFYLKNDVPRTIGDDSTLSGTLKLMESLFDQEKISGKDFTFLINAFTQIQWFDAVELLKEHERRMLLTGLNQSTLSLASMMPSIIDQLLEDVEDDQMTVRDYTPLIKAGQKFGGPGGGHFDDSSPLTFTTSHYLSGIIINIGTNNFGSCQFIYTSSFDNQSRIESAIHGNYGQEIKSKKRFDLNYGERIYAVQVNMNDINFAINGNQSNIYRTKIITGLQFFTRKGRSIPSNNYLTNGEKFTEQFNGYTLGYAYGRAGLRIDQLQFFWY